MYKIHQYAYLDVLFTSVCVTQLFLYRKWLYISRSFVTLPFVFLNINTSLTFRLFSLLKSELHFFKVFGTATTIKLSFVSFLHISKFLHDLYSCILLFSSIVIHKWRQVWDNSNEKFSLILFPDGKLQPTFSSFRPLYWRLNIFNVTLNDSLNENYKNLESLIVYSSSQLSAFSRNHNNNTYKIGLYASSHIFSFFLLYFSLGLCCSNFSVCIRFYRNELVPAAWWTGYIFLSSWSALLFNQK